MSVREEGPALSSARLTGPAVPATERTAREASRRRYLTVLLVVRNPLAEPYVLGVSAGASLAAVLVLTTFGAAGVWLAYGVPLAAFGGAVATLVVVALGRGQGRLDPVRLSSGGNGSVW